MHGVHKCAVSLEPHTHPGMPGIRPAAAPWAARVALAGRAILAGGLPAHAGRRPAPVRSAPTAVTGARGRDVGGRVARPRPGGTGGRIPWERRSPSGRCPDTPEVQDCGTSCLMTR